MTGKAVTGRLIFRSPPFFVQSLVGGGIDIVFLANNHANDGGIQGIIETIETLRKAGIKYVGTGRDYYETRSLRIIEVRDRKIGFLAYTDLANIGLERAVATSNRPGVASARSKAVFDEISTAKRKVDLLVVSFHWGVEDQIDQPNKRQKDLAYRSIKEGADVVVGHHLHVLQKVEIYQGKTIAYSLGNFVFGSRRLARNRTMILWIDWNSKTKEQKIKLIPCYIRNGRPELVK